jgi:hypothetical protein
VAQLVVVVKVSDLFAQTVENMEATAGLNPTLCLVSPATRRGLAENLVGRLVVNLGIAVGGVFNVSASGEDLIRRRALADALQNLVGVMCLYGMTPELLADVLGWKNEEEG